jgi:hypothetical protein
MWTVDQLVGRLSASRELRRSRNRRLLQVALVLAVWLLAAGWLASTGIATATVLVNAWFIALPVFLLYVVFSSRRARQRRATICPSCNEVIDDAWEEEWEAYVFAALPTVVQCPRCQAIIAAASA